MHIINMYFKMLSETIFFLHHKTMMKQNLTNYLSFRYCGRRWVNLSVVFVDPDFRWSNSDLLGGRVENAYNRLPIVECGGWQWCLYITWKSLGGFWWRRWWIRNLAEGFFLFFCFVCVFFGWRELVYWNFCLWLYIMDISWILTDVCVLGFEVFGVGLLKNLQGKNSNKTGWCEFILMLSIVFSLFVM